MPQRKYLSVMDMSQEDIQARLDEIEHSYEEFFCAARDGFFISTREGWFLDCNDALVKMLGYRVTEEVLILDLVNKLWMTPEDRKRFQETIESQGEIRELRGPVSEKGRLAALCDAFSTALEGSISRDRGIPGIHSGPNPGAKCSMTGYKPLRSSSENSLTTFWMGYSWQVWTEES